MIVYNIGMRKYQSVMSNFNQFLETVSYWKNNSLDFGDGIVLFRGEIHIIKTVGDYPGIFISEIARRFGVTRAVISKSINKMEKNGYILKTPDPKDQKRMQVYLTELGQKAYVNHESFHKQHDNFIYEHLEKLDDKELEAINTFLLNARNMVKNHF